MSQSRYERKALNRVESRDRSCIGCCRTRSDENTIVIGPWMMKAGEDAVVGRRLREGCRERCAEMA